jgi:hypothetical protein
MIDNNPFEDFLEAWAQAKKAIAELMRKIGPEESPKERERLERERPRRNWSIPRRAGKNTLVKLYHRRLQRDRKGSPTSRNGKRKD